MATVSYAIEEIEVAPTLGQISARVVEGASGVQGLDLNLYDAGGTTVLETLESAADGRVLFEALAPGDYDVEVVLPEGYEMAGSDEARKEVAVTAGATTNVQFSVVAPDDGVVEIMAKLQRLKTDRRLLPRGPPRRKATRS